MKQVYLHIGLHKTGTTYIQRVLSENRLSLYKYGINYPRFGAEFLFGHHNIAWSLMPGATLKNVSSFSLASLPDILAQTAVDKIILSSEEFDFLNFNHVDKLHQILLDFEVRVILYVRNPFYLFYSLWQEAVKHGYTLSLVDYYAQVLKDPASFDYAKIAHTWSEIFGKDMLNIVIYDNLVDQKIDIANYLLQVIVGADLDVRTFSLPKHKVNPSASIGVTEVLRQLNCMHQSAENQEGLAANFMRYLKQTDEGRSIQHDLLGLYQNPSSFIELKPLESIFTPLMSKLADDFIDQICNAVSKDCLFANYESSSLSFPQIEEQLIVQNINLDKIYQTIAV